MESVNGYGMLGPRRRKACGTPTGKYQHSYRVLRRGLVRIARSCHLFRAAQPSGTPDELITSADSPLSTLLRSRPLKKTPGQWPFQRYPQCNVRPNQTPIGNRQSAQVVPCRSIQGDPGSEHSGPAHAGIWSTCTIESGILEVSRGPRRAPKRAG